MEIDINYIENMKDDLKNIRRDLHKIPEIGLKEWKTAEYIEEKLKSFGIQNVQRVLDTGIIAVVKGVNSNNSICFRADMDALSIEETPKEYASCHKGVMHACGHDGHMAIVLGMAKYLANMTEKPPVDVVLLFQPAEEGPGGAKLILETGILNKLNVKYIIGCHIFPTFEQGTISCRAGAMMARNGEVYIDIKGKSAHGAMPHLGADAILATSAVMSAIHTVMARNISPLDGGVLTFGTIHGGDACNIIPESVRVEGTMRAFSDDVFYKMEERLKEIVHNIPIGFGCSGNVECKPFYRVVNNNEHLVDILKDVCGNKYQTTEPFMLAEDFSFYQQEFDGLFFFLGSKNTEKNLVAPLHSQDFDFDEEILINGVKVFVDMLHRLGDEFK